MPALDSRSDDPYCDRKQEHNHKNAEQNYGRKRDARENLPKSTDSLVNDFPATKMIHSTKQYPDGKIVGNKGLRHSQQIDEKKPKSFPQASSSVDATELR